MTPVMKRMKEILAAIREDSRYDFPDPDFIDHLRAAAKTALADLAEYLKRLEDTQTRYLDFAQDEKETKDLKKLKSAATKADKLREFIQGFEVALNDLVREIDKREKHALADHPADL